MQAPPGKPEEDRRGAESPADSRGDCRFLVEKIFSCWLILLLFVCRPLHSQETPSPSDQEGNFYKISVPVDLVVLPVTVLDRRGRFVTGLNKENFAVYENGQLQQIKLFLHEDIPVTAGLVIDNSGSMRRKIGEVNVAALAFARSSNPQDEMFVVKFNERVTMGLPEGVAFTSREDQLDAALARTSPRGMTALYDATITALEHLKLGSRPKKVLLLVSDGGDNCSKHHLSQVLELAKKSDAVIYTIGLYDVLGPERNLRALKRLARLTGGEAFLPETVDKIESICQRIASDIRNQYTLEYVPSDRNRDGTYREVRVMVHSQNHAKLAVRTRAGYYAPCGDTVALSQQGGEIPCQAGLDH